jgi:hypothetical protein
VALAAPTLWTDICIMEYDSEETKEAAHIYLERSKACPIFLTCLRTLTSPFQESSRTWSSRERNVGRGSLSSLGTTWSQTLCSPRWNP